MGATERAKGRRPEYGRIVSGRAIGPEDAAADRQFVALGPHNREEHGRTRHPTECLTRGGRRVVPRLRD